ncbi:MAG: bifunctional folylpolyglutamate synthase/dihydrofolate synthase [Sediminispirochaetaceae bacterium]
MYDSADEIFEYLSSFINFEKTRKQTIREYRLDRMRALLDYFGNPQRELRCIHVAGSKGKGSTSLYLARGLSACGYKTGLYASPHVSNFRERISLAGEFFPDELYIQEGGRIITDLEELQSRPEWRTAEPTAFELFTLLGFLVFRAAGCSMAVIETGIGGRLDATNVIDPLAVVISSIELEHTDILGSSIEEVASEKAGITKPGAPVFVGPQKFPAALSVLQDRASDRGGDFFYAPDFITCTETHQDRRGTSAEYVWKPNPVTEAETGDSDSGFTLRLAMPGAVQAENAGLAVLVLKVLNGRGMIETGGGSWREAFPVLSDAVAKARLPGRMEIVGETPAIALDGAHTPVSVGRSVETFRQIFGDQWICIFGSVEGKDTEGMAEILTSYTKRIIVSTPGSFKPNNPREVFDIFRRFTGEARFEPNPETALHAALTMAGDAGASGASGSPGTLLPILVTGSFYMVAEIRRLLTKQTIQPTTEVT